MSSARRQAAGGSTCGAAPSAGTSAAVTRRHRSTPASMPPSSGIPSSRAMSRARIGSGISSTRSPSKVPSWRRHTITPSTRPFPGQPTGCRPTGSVTSIDRAAGARGRRPRPRHVPAGQASAYVAADHRHGPSVDEDRRQGPRIALAPPRDHWWHVTLAATPRGLTTGGTRRQLQIDFDFLDDRLVANRIRGSGPRNPLAVVTGGRS